MIKDGSWAAGPAPVRQLGTAESLLIDSALTAAVRETCVYMANPSLESEVVPRLLSWCSREASDAPIVLFLACAILGRELHGPGPLPARSPASREGVGARGGLSP